LYCTGIQIILNQKSEEIDYVLSSNVSHIININFRHFNLQGR